jgi:hypothetical protein
MAAQSSYSATLVRTGKQCPCTLYTICAPSQFTGGTRLWEASKPNRYRNKVTEDTTYLFRFEGPLNVEAS